MEQLRRLDKSTTKSGTIISIATGILGCLLLGVGMCCTMVWMGKWFLPGDPLYTRITKKEREKAAPQILKLTEELEKPE